MGSVVIFIIRTVLLVSDTGVGMVESSTSVLIYLAGGAVSLFVGGKHYSLVRPS